MADAGFPFVADASAAILILGSMPGRESLRQQQYYAHPRNAFWPIMGQLFGFDASLPYHERLSQLQRHHVALWDVVQRCRRPGSLDADIREAEANDFATFFAAHPHIRHLFFNGAKAESLYLKLVRPGLDERWQCLPARRLPSTSPAHAAMRADQKLELWRSILAPLKRPVPDPMEHI